MMNQKNINDSFDAYSKEPVSKLQLLECLHQNLKFQYSFKESAGTESPTGAKPSYFSTDKKAKALGYVPKLTSLEVIESELRELV
jgi:hypothetical protein